MPILEIESLLAVKIDFCIQNIYEIDRFRGGST